MGVVQFKNSGIKDNFLIFSEINKPTKNLRKPNKNQNI